MAGVGFWNSRRKGQIGTAPNHLAPGRQKADISCVRDQTRGGFRRCMDLGTRFRSNKAGLRQSPRLRGSRRFAGRLQFAATAALPFAGNVLLVIQQIRRLAARQHCVPLPGRFTPGRWCVRQLGESVNRMRTQPLIVEAEGHQVWVRLLKSSEGMQAVLVPGPGMRNLLRQVWIAR